MRLQPNRGWSDNVIERHPKRSGYTSVTYVPFYEPKRRMKMPCRTDPPTSNELRNCYEEEFTHDSKLAEIFCATMLKLEAIDEGSSDPIILLLPKKAQAWWNQHKERDRKKVATERKAMEREQAIENALSKLSPEERKLLGVKTR